MEGVEGEEDKDENIDSDETFGENDTERFEGFSFRGSGRSIDTHGVGRGKKVIDGGYVQDEVELPVEMHHWRFRRHIK